MTEIQEYTYVNAKNNFPLVEENISKKLSTMNSSKFQPFRGITNLNPSTKSLNHKNQTGSFDIPREGDYVAEFNIQCDALIQKVSVEIGDYLVYENDKVNSKNYTWPAFYQYLLPFIALQYNTVTVYYETEEKEDINCELNVEYVLIGPEIRRNLVYNCHNFKDIQINGTNCEAVIKKGVFNWIVSPYKNVNKNLIITKVIDPQCHGGFNIPHRYDYIISYSLYSPSILTSVVVKASSQIIQKFDNLNTHTFQWGGFHNNLLLPISYLLYSEITIEYTTDNSDIKTPKLEISYLSVDNENHQKSYCKDSKLTVDINGKDYVYRICSGMGGWVGNSIPYNQTYVNGRWEDACYLSDNKNILNLSDIKEDLQKMGLVLS